MRRIPIPQVLNILYSILVYKQSVICAIQNWA